LRSNGISRNRLRSEQQQNLQTLISKGAPNLQFLWPMQLATAPNIPGFGYIMPLREPRYKSIVDLMKRRIEPSFRALSTTGLQLRTLFWNSTLKGCAIGIFPLAMSFSIPTPAIFRFATTIMCPLTAKATAAY
jgi:hypothetical protein